MSLRGSVEDLTRAGVCRLYAKTLAPNDNSKNQVYLGGSLEAVNLLPVVEIVADPDNSKRMKAPLDFKWLTPSGLVAAPNAQLILYPEYPEVRLSGFLKGSLGAPNALMTSREPGRVLLLGVTAGDVIIAMVLPPESQAAREFVAREEHYQQQGVFRELPPPDEGDTDGDGFTRLMTRLSAIHRKGWIRSWSLASGGVRKDCESPQCGGYTLEAELGIERNGRSEPDFHGWEIKSFDVPSIDRPPPGGKALTLMTPEPTGAMYQDDFAEFWRRYSYADRSGKPGREQRKNFGGIYRCGIAPHPITGLRLELTGYDPKLGTFEPNGALVLLDKQDVVAAAWSFSSLLEKWSRKHARAAYVPVERALDGLRRYRYAGQVALGRATNFGLMLRATAAGAIYLDPAIKFEQGRFKKRNQFRVHYKHLNSLYRSYETVPTD